MMEEAARIFETPRRQKVTHLSASGTDADTDSLILEAEGRADALHRGWKVAMNLLEYLCGISTLTAQLVEQVQQVGDIPLLVTRKHLPGMKKPMIKAILSGGAHPHRSGIIGNPAGFRKSPEPDRRTRRFATTAPQNANGSLRKENRHRVRHLGTGTASSYCRSRSDPIR